MTKTDIYFNLIDVTAKKDTTAEVTDKQSFIDMNDFKLEGVTAPKVATLETDYWKLDGTFDTFPDKPETVSWGLWSNKMSDAQGQFDTPISLTLTFAENHTIIGLSFEFNQYDNSYCNDMSVTFYKDDTAIKAWNLQPNNWRYSKDETVINFNKIVIVFNSMNKPDRYLKIQSIIYGLMKKFDEDTIITANVLEEIDLTGSELTVNTLDFTMYSADDDFNIFNPKGIYHTLQKRQQIKVVGTNNNTEMNLGTFYLDEWTAAENKMMTLNCVDAIGVMDGTYYDGGLYENQNAQTVIDDLMNDAGFGYSLDSKLANVKINGWLPKCTHREALQQIAIAIGAYIDTSRDGEVKIKALPSFDDDAIYTLDKNRKIVGTTVALKTYVSGVDVTEHKYTKKSSTEQLFKDTLDVGENEIIFDSPCQVTKVSGGTIIKSGINYVIVNVPASAEITVTGYKYEDNTQVQSARLPDISAGEKENILEVTNATLISNNGYEVAQRLLYLAQFRIEQNLGFILKNENIGGIANIEVLDDEYRKSIITKLETDLVNGFNTKAVTIGE